MREDGETVFFAMYTYRLGDKSKKCDGSRKYTAREKEITDYVMGELAKNDRW
jgi:hypothetical protein